MNGNKIYPCLDFVNDETVRDAAAKAIQTALFELFVAEIGDHQPPKRALGTLESELARCFRSPSLERRSGRFRLAWSSDSRFAKTVRSSVELLTSDDASRIRMCAADDCEWLFLDRSKNRSRRWCDMKVCGNRVKARRFYARWS
jgi:predicted RNA-binding Zn ribbon-like protein